MKNHLYCFWKLDIKKGIHKEALEKEITEYKLDKKFNIKDDQKFCMDLLRQEKMLIVQGTGFNWPEPNHFRMVFLPSIDVINDACDRLEHFLKTYRQ